MNALTLKTSEIKCSFTRRCQTSVLAEVHFIVFDQKAKKTTPIQKPHSNPKTTLDRIKLLCVIGAKRNNTEELLSGFIFVFPRPSSLPSTVTSEYLQDVLSNVSSISTEKDNNFLLPQMEN